MSELKPCPFCGCENILVKKRKTTMIECADCGVVVFDVQDGKQRDPFLLWNTRSDSAAQAEIARLRGALERCVSEAVADEIDEWYANAKEALK